MCAEKRIELALCRKEGRVTVAEVAEVTGVSRTTIKNHFKALKSAGHPQQHDAGQTNAAADPYVSMELLRNPGPKL